MAADLPYRAAPPPIFTQPAFAWTGFYAGVNAGDALGRDSIANKSTDLASTFSALNANKVRLNSNNFAGCGQIGYNYQLTPGNGVVLGIEADADYVGLDRKRRTQHTSNPTTPNEAGMSFIDADRYVGESSTDALFIVRGRAGYAFDRFLVYGTGGLVFPDVRTRSTYTSTETTYQDGKVIDVDSSTKKHFRLSGIQTGYAAGGGIEYALPQLESAGHVVSIRVEYLHYDLGQRTTKVDDTLRSKVHNECNLIHAGLNYKFSDL
ncbi:outer membrane protein [Methylobacterium persicinum]|uniref:Outer membrane immunogenic protein n=1 Tax=Methylobacterium persicinum TaxID=374426 RepID=A0ABU0HGU0_9HYPH|nr:porin family protein [Methylobacterium persicinum]MDQ0441533.1 outer membrane immunogenic protein [Methylobacterium persicinum]GJE39296.1 hypothetical protein KHHGKMAE_3377 [Methylobacterium persicinum]